jgi:UDPglucose--hexose-1-phosphate uridylyltransferase
MSSTGSHEVIIETPEHIANIADLPQDLIKDVFSTYCSRFYDLEKDHRIKNVLIFKNYGWEAGVGRINHSRSQLIATPVNLKRVKEELEGSKFYYDYHERCVFCDIIRQEEESGQRVILEQDGFIALIPFAPRFPYEVWVLPKRHSPDFSRINPEEINALAKIMKTVLTKIKKLLNDPAYNYMMHTAPFRRPQSGFWSTIEEDYHWHIEITPSLTKVAGFEWGTGFYISPVSPEEAAKALRETVV